MKKKIQKKPHRVMLHVYSGAIKEWGLALNFCGFLRKPELYAPTISRDITHTYSEICKNVRKYQFDFIKITPIYSA